VYAVSVLCPVMLLASVIFAVFSCGQVRSPGKLGGLQQVDHAA